MISNNPDMAILSFIHCSKCMDEFMKERPEHESMKIYSKLSVGLTAEGFQVWCDRHDANVFKIAFEGLNEQLKRGKNCKTRMF